ncbi:MAG: class I SAM-dependent methyltransferase [Bacillota bacterium]
MFGEQSIISKWIADMYDHNETGTDDVEFLLSVIGQAPKRVLEIGCGSGRILVPMAIAGHIVTGLDFDEFMLNKLLQKAKGMNNIIWRKADVIQDAWGNGFDVVVIAGNFLFNIVSEMEYKEAQRLLVQKAADALISGGRVYIDCGYTMYPEKWFSDSGENMIWEGTDDEGNTGRMVLLESSYDKDSRIYRFTRRFELVLADGNVINQDIPCLKHFASLEQIHEWLDSAGFVIENEYGDYKRNPIGENTNRAIIWAKKHS